MGGQDGVVRLNDSSGHLREQTHGLNYGTIYLVKRGELSSGENAP